MTEGEELVEVRLLRLPLAVHRRATEHQDELMRELTLIDIDPTTAPARVQELTADLRDRYAGFTAGPSEALAQALERREETIDLVYRVPRSAAEAAEQLGQVLDEFDQFCEEGGLLTLASPAEGRAYRRWFLGEFVGQIGGADPVPWPEYRDRAS